MFFACVYVFVAWLFIFVHPSFNFFQKTLLYSCENSCVARDIWFCLTTSPPSSVQRQLCLIVPVQSIVVCLSFFHSLFRYISYPVISVSIDKPHPEFLFAFAFKTFFNSL